MTNVRTLDNYGTDFGFSFAGRTGAGGTCHVARTFGPQPETGTLGTGLGEAHDVVELDEALEFLVFTGTEGAVFLLLQ